MNEPRDAASRAAAQGARDCGSSSQPSSAFEYYLIIICLLCCMTTFRTFVLDGFCVVAYTRQMPVGGVYAGVLSLKIEPVPGGSWARARDWDWAWGCAAASVVIRKLNKFHKLTSYPDQSWPWHTSATTQNANCQLSTRQKVQLATKSGTTKEFYVAAQNVAPTGCKEMQ